MAVIAMTDRERGAANFLRVGLTRLRAGAAEAAADAFGQAAALRPEMPEAWANLGLARRAMGDLAGAARALDHAAALAPGADEIQAELAIALDFLGRADEAADRLAAMVRAGRGGTRAVAGLARAAVHAGRAGEIRALVEAHLPDPVAPASDRRTYHFAAAELHDCLGDHARAFGHARAANALADRGYDRAAAESEIAALIAAAAALPKAVHAAPGPGVAAETPRPLFIVGMPRSGTSLMERVLAAHPWIVGAGEHRALDGLARSLPAPWAASSADLAAALRLAGAAYRASLPATIGAAAWAVDKTPLNLLHLPWAARMLPEARFVWMRRDARDVGLSCYFQSFAEGHGFAFDLSHCGHFHGLVARLHRTWSKDLGERLLTVDYEGLVTGFEGATRRVLDHLGLGWDDALHRFHEGGAGPTATASHHQIRRPISTASIGRWRPYAAYLGPLTAALAEAGLRLPATRPAA